MASRKYFEAYHHKRRMSPRRYPHKRLLFLCIGAPDVYYVRLRIRTEVRCVRKIGTEIE
jgi:hypothetical protein